MPRPGDLRDWIERLPENGRYVFTRAEATGASGGVSAAASKMTLYRLEEKGRIVRPRRDFFVLVPPDYRSAGSPPASWFIDDLMRHLGRRYYVGLLTAAALHGAGHQRPMVFQVIADGAEREIEVGRVRIEFHVSRRVEEAATLPVQTVTGSMVVATPETTAFDLVRFPAAAGYWSNIATVLSELAEKLSPAALADASARVAQTDVQRLGWMLDFVEQCELANSLAGVLDGKRLQPTRLSAADAADPALLDPRWRVLVNADVEPDL